MNKDDQILLFNPKKQKEYKVEAKREFEKQPLEHSFSLDSISSFQDFKFDPWLVDTLNSLSIMKPTDVQKACIPLIQAGNDIIASAKTGSGKTAAFALPILHHLSKDPYGIFAVVLTPTRELAQQIAEQFQVFGKDINLKLSLVIGGVDVTKQTIELSRRPHVLVATPGRLSDIIETSLDGSIFRNAKYLVLDEADRLLNASFRPELISIMKIIPKTSQRLLFSATLSKSLSDVEFLSLDAPKFFHLNEEYGTVDKVEQKYLLIPIKMKLPYLFYLLLNDFNDKSVIIFVGRCKTAELLKVMCKNLELNCSSLHSLMPQNDRTASLGRFRSNLTKILIATDVGSRGLDIPDVQVVVNFDIPCDARDYVHRIGRTARKGRGGQAISFVTEHDLDLIKNIEAKIEKQLDEYSVNEAAVLKKAGKIMEAKRKAAMNLADRDFDSKKRKID